MIETWIHWLVETIAAWGYPGIIFLMALESSVFPVPSEAVLIPAGYLAFKGEMDITLVVLCGTLGSLIGAFTNYYVSLFVGRAFLLRFGKYVLVSEKTLLKNERFFTTHGAISTFIGRLLPGIRHFISIPAGLAQMNVTLFATFTALGAGLWSFILAALGYTIGENQALVHEYMHHILAVTFVSSIILATSYYALYRRRQKLLSMVK